MQVTGFVAKSLPPVDFSSLSDREYLWSESIRLLGIESATLLSESVYDLARRTYVYEDRVYKIVLWKYESTRTQRRQTLAGEFTIAKHCHGIPGIPEVTDHRRVGDIEVAVFKFVPGSPLSRLHVSLLRSCAILGRLSLILFRISLRGVSHNDILPDNVIVASDGGVSLVDFDQAVQVSPGRALVRNFVGRGDRMMVCVSFASIAKHQLEQYVPPSIVQLLGRVLNRGLRCLERRLPKVPKNASPKIKALLEAWELAQVSDSNAPGQKLSYYSLEVNGYHFPGERPWMERWHVLRDITDFQGKRILDLGCNLGLLSCFLLKAGASAVLAVDRDSIILAAAQKVTSAFGVSPVFCQKDFDASDDWETDLIKFNPDIVFALSTLNWVRDKQRFMLFLSRFREVIFEGHESVTVETRRFRDAGFDEITLIAVSERGRPVLHCRKQVTCP